LFFGKLGTKAYFKNRGKEMNKKQLIEEIKEIERKVEELKKNVPVHSPRVFSKSVRGLKDLTVIFPIQTIASSLNFTNMMKRRQ